MARSAKFQVMNSMTGRSPTMAAPTPTPAKPSSVIGVSTTRIGPELVEQPAAHLVGALVDADLLAHEEDVGVALHLLAEGLVQRVAVGDDWHDQC